VTERAIFHTEVQTEDRDLATIPNLFLVTNPVIVVHSSGTIISANLSLGYDISHVRIEELLKEAAEKAGLEDAFVLVGELGDFSVSYRVGGFSGEVTRLLTIKSHLRKQILSVMHENGIEIVSPNFMNQRVLRDGEKMIPGPEGTPESEAPDDSGPEDVIFEKADSAAEREALRNERTAPVKALEELDDQRKANPDAAEDIARERDQIKTQIEMLEKTLAEPEP